MQGRSRYAFFTLVLLAVLAPEGHAEPIIGTGGVSSFTGNFNYSFTDANNATLTVSLTNNSAGGFLTAFAFNNPSDLITGVSLSDPNFHLLGTAPFQNGISAPPFGDFDIGASTSIGSWVGGGSPSTGIGAGDTKSFTFTLTGAGLDTLTAQSFFDELSSSASQGSGPQAFVARFRGATEGGDKVPGHLGRNPDIGTSPEPGSLALAGAALLCLAARRASQGRRKRLPA